MEQEMLFKIAHPAAQVVLGGAALVVAAPILIPASETSYTFMMNHPIGTIRVIEAFDGAYGGAVTAGGAAVAGKTLSEFGIIP